MSTMELKQQKVASLNGADFLKRSLRGVLLIAILVVLCVGFSLADPNFMTVDNMMNIVRQVSMIAITAVGMTIVIIIGGIDLSVGAIAAFCGVMAAMTFTSTGSVSLSVLSCLAIGTLIGFANGFVSAKGRIAGFIATLATMSIFRGLSYILTGGYPISVLDESYVFLGTGYFGSIPIPVITMLVVVAFGSFLTQQTKFGRYVYALGGNEQATKWSGINVDIIKICAYTLNGLLAALSGVILSARLGSGQPSAGIGFEMDVITGVIVGGTSLAGGAGTIGGTLIGVLLIGVINNGMDIMGISTYFQMLVKGFIILIAVLVDTFSRRRAE